MNLSFDEWFADASKPEGVSEPVDLVPYRWAKAGWEAALAEMEPPCTNPLRSEIDCASLVRDNDLLRARLAEGGSKLRL